MQYFNSKHDLHGERARGAEMIQSWLIERIATLRCCAQDEIDIRIPFADYGLSSREAISLSGELEEFLGRALPETLLYTYPTIEALAHALAENTAFGGYKPDDEAQAPGTQPIAIIGMSCRFPGASGIQAFWELLCSGGDAITRVPLERWKDTAFGDTNPVSARMARSQWGGFLSEIDQFDAQFFGIAAREASRMDPQQRLLLEVSWEALEDAGLAVESLAGTKTGVFIGISNNEYGQEQVRDYPSIEAYTATGNALSIAANRISYFFDFHGPSLAIDTACSSSLVAVHMACESLQNGESAQALVGGVNLILSPAPTINFSKAGAMAADGRCKAFDARADGYVRGEGVGVVILKPLARALADGDSINAIIRGSAINQDGRTNGLMAPNQHAQEAMLREAYRRAAISPGRVQYVEAHGTGTSLGDNIEARALGAVLSQDRPAEQTCALGSVKTNIGHLEAAAGIAGLIKVALSLKHGLIPSNLHFVHPHPDIPFKQLRLHVQQELVPWPVEQGSYIAGVSSFGFGGTNAHVVLQKVPTLVEQQMVHQSAKDTGYVLPLSAHSFEALHERAGQMQSFLRDLACKREHTFFDLCSTAARRSHLDYRLAFAGQSQEEVMNLLEAYLRDERPAGVSEARRSVVHPHKVAFVFSGQGGQWLGMGRSLMESEPVFRAVIERCEKVMSRFVDWSLVEELTATPEKSRLHLVEVIQPAIFVLQIALAALWRSWGIEPAAIIGHSMGEVAAAYVAGALSLEDAVHVICLRGRVLKQVSGQGAMALVEISLEQTQEILGAYAGRLSIAASNGPTSTVISGEEEALEEVLETLQSNDIFCRRIKVDFASHSPHMEPLSMELVRLLQNIQPRPAGIPLYSTVSGQPQNGEELTARYWGENLHQPVLFAPMVQRMVEDGYDVFLEVNPHPLLVPALHQVLRHMKKEGTVLSSLYRGSEDRLALLKSVGVFYTLGCPIIWQQIYSEKGRHVHLPEYPWQHERFWFLGTKADSHAATSVWPTVVEAGIKQSEHYPEGLVIDLEQVRIQDLAQLTSNSILRTLQDVGIYTRVGDIQSVDTLMQHIGILPLYRKLLQRWLIRLTQEGYLRQEGDQFICLVPFPETDLDNLWNKVRSYSQQTAYLLHLDYLERCSKHLAEVLRGEMSPLDLLFPGGSFQTAEALYQFSPIARYFNGIAQALVLSFVESAYRSQPIRVLEVGSGTGGTSSALLPILPAGRTTYVFTDVSNLFLGRGRQKFQEYLFVRYGLLDIEEDPLKQGYEERSFDLVIAANVLHATRDIDITLEHIRALLAPGGCLILWEITHHQSWFDISFGLIEGWERYDDDLRKDNPLLSTTQWLAALQRHGFIQATAFPAEGSAGEILQQHVILARVPGELAKGESDARSDPGKAQQEDVVSQFYDLASGKSGETDHAYESIFLTFAPFQHIVPHFSWLQAFYTPESNADHAQLLVQAQAEMRSVVFNSIDFSAVESVLDIGCGYASDLIALAEKHPQLCLDGYTISAKQASVGKAKAEASGYADRVRVFYGDSAKDEFPNQYDVVLSFEVAGHIQQKGALFSNISRHLNDEGMVLLIDFVANTASAIEYEDTGAFTVTANDWSDILAQENLCLINCIDATEEVANFLTDERFKEHLSQIVAERNLPDVVERTLHSYDNIGKALRRRIIRYVLLIAQKAVTLSPEIIKHKNRACFASARTYSEVLAASQQPSEVMEQRAWGSLDHWLYGLHWQPRSHGTHERTTVSPSVTAKRTWLIFADDNQSGRGRRLIEQMTQQGEYPVLVSPGTAFQCLNAQHYEIQPEKREDIQQLFNVCLGGSYPAWNGILYLWGCNRGSVEQLTGEDLEQEVLGSCSSALLILQELAGREWESRPHLWLITRGAHLIGSNIHPLSLSQTPLWGLGRVIANEHPGFWGGIIDLDPGSSEEEDARLLIQEISLPGGEDQIAFRAGLRCCARLTRVNPASEQERSFPWRSDATYLITGGFGALGPVVAKWLVKQGARRLILMGRTAIPERSAWSQITEHKELAQHIATIQALEAEGASVHVAAVDVADAGALQEFLDQFRQECWPPIRGVVHAAGLVEGKTLLELDRSSLQAVLRPKVQGAWNLHRFFADVPLDFFILFSSASSLLGPPGQGNYAAANAFLDALAQARRSQGLPAMSMNWGPWVVVGQAARTLVERYTIQGIQTIRPAQGMKIFGHLLRTERAGTAIIPADRQSWSRFSPTAERSPLLSSILDEQAHSSSRSETSRESLLNLPVEERRSAIATYVHTQVAHVLGLPVAKLDIHRPLTQVGIDSLMTVELKNRFEVDLSVALSVSKLLQGMNTEGVVDEISEHLSREFSLVPLPAKQEGNAPGRLSSSRHELDELSPDELEHLLQELSLEAGE